MLNRKWFRLISFLTLLFLFIASSNVRAADNYTHDADISRDNTVNDSSFNGLIYNSNPYYVEISKWNGYQQYSYTTPVVVGNKLYQYTYDDSDYGHLWEVDLTKPVTTGQYAWTPGNGITLNAKIVQNFYAPPSGPNGEVNSGAGVSGPTITNGYLAIAVGEYLYWWPIDHPDQMQSSPIRGNSGNAIQQIAASPLITPALTASGTDLTSGQTVTWQTPFAVVGSWSGGVISQPLYSPANVLAIPNYYKTTDDSSNATNDIVTSSPAWNLHTTAVGTQGAAVFGVDAAESGKNRLILMDPMTGNYKTCYSSSGSPIFYGPIDSSPAVASDGRIYVPDQGAAIYQLSANGDLLADDISAMDQSNPCITNLALDGENIIWVGNGHSTLNATTVDLIGQGDTQISSFSGLDSPAVVRNGSTDTIFIASTGTAGLLVTSPMSCDNLPVAFQQADNQQTWKRTWQTLGAVSAPYTSVAADVGTDPSGTDLHYLAAWTNYGLDTQGCIELWAPASYSVTASATPSIVDEGNPVTIVATPYPTSVTKSMTAHITDGKSTPVDITLSQNPNDTWSGMVVAPNNTTGQQTTYTVTVTATNNGGETAQATTSFSVNPGPWNPQGTIPATLQIDAYGLQNLTDKLPDGTAKYGDYLVATLKVNPPAPPSGYLNATITGVAITKASITHKDGVPNVGGSGNDPLLKITQSTTNMTPQGSTATCQFRESWAGYPPPIPDDGTVIMESDDLYAQFNVHVTYEYQVPIPTKAGVIFIWQTGSYDASGTASYTLNITGTEYYTYTTSVVQFGDSE
ncbi:hypothetical protein Desaci_4101 [Desulfosporosinus acidiphilus SJ4]|uniref:Uncharacterized protein n=1 Tax=Desulfosporosinus acidiphilus (strain DSM 22704 / JCM 16185 / SJ4) TaxID=646529 RepID=I4DAZ0_DESAJ|nr:hypothetical protein [Desulfosporosinus acidiphilus]AFM42964.1 hypothetical protein Desaci_4101 [Desulfosporosinus acidiphilus SJ4]